MNILSLWLFQNSTDFTCDPPQFHVSIPSRCQFPRCRWFPILIQRKLFNQSHRILRTKQATEMLSWDRTSKTSMQDENFRKPKLLPCSPVISPIWFGQEPSSLMMSASSPLIPSFPAPRCCSSMSISATSVPVIGFSFPNRTVTLWAFCHWKLWTVNLLSKSLTLTKA